MIRRSIPLATALALLVPLAFGCARRPSTPLSSAPAPSRTTASTSSSTAPAGADGPSAVARTAVGTSAGTASSTAPPAAARPVPADFRAIDALASIHFDFDRADIRSADRPVLERNAAWMKQHVGDLILIEGHADERGTNAYNIALGQRRAEATRNYLVAQGVKAERFTLISYGEERPLCTQHTEACWSQNRRAQFLVKPQ